ncbi:hypothetical protein EJ06DRAFT_557351 [Trichodelitschia bisporula]|uniref:AMP-activated protein kinase glycogen-binding domain-containing protein n=1 Tax=Trichodelitschia bisporula TaxID=703511 RepID=A0A6G1HUG6_9PEZI|nr:hypothetical protein EJ06DRAFT_557351 [Trichodelitschia bisporula]
MGSYTFKWEHPEAKEVFVTGSFDDWTKSVTLERNHDGVFEKKVDFPLEEKKITYKFVVDGKWIHNHTAACETDEHGNVNNVLYLQDIIPHGQANVLSSAAPKSTTAGLAGQVPKEGDKEATNGSSIPGAFIETPGIEEPSFVTPATEPSEFSVKPIPATDGPGNPISLKAGEKVPDPSTITNNTIESTVKEDKAVEPEEETFSVKPIPATAGAGNPIHLAPGEKVPDPSTLTDNTVQSTVDLNPKDDEAEEEQSFSVKPIPATAGTGNPIHLAPGEKVPDPSTLTGNTVESTVKLDPESYEKSDAAAAVVPPKDDGAVKPADTDLFNLPPVSNNMIPESSLPIVGENDVSPTIQSAAPTSTTAALAGQVPLESARDATIHSAAPNATTAGLAAQVPLEPEVPEVVIKSQEEAHVDPEASANPIAVEEKKEVENELKSKVPEVDADKGITGAVAGAVTVGAAAVAGAVTAATTSVTETVDNAKSIASGTVDSATEKAMGEAKATEEATVPEIVTKSIAAAHAEPEATTNPVAVEEKKEVEAELESKIKPVESSGEPAPTETAATSAVAPGDVPLPKPAAEKTPEPAAAPSPAPAAVENAEATKSQDAPVVTTGPETKTTEAKSEAPKTEAPKAEAAPAVAESSKATETTPKTAAPKAETENGNTDSVKAKKSKRKSIIGKFKKLFH